MFRVKLTLLKLITWFTMVHPANPGISEMKTSTLHPFGCFQKLGYPKMDGLEWKTLLKWMIWGYHYFWKHPFSDRTMTVKVWGLVTLRKTKLGRLNHTLRFPQTRCAEWDRNIYLLHTIHVWYIYLHLVVFNGKIWEM